MAHIAVLALPAITCREEWTHLQGMPNMSLRWVQQPQEMQTAQLIVLPGSRDSAGDLQWMRQQGLDAAVVAHAQAGGLVLAVGGGLPMLGEALIDLQCVQGNAAGLGLLPCVTLRAQPQAIEPLHAVHVQWQQLRGAWSALNGHGLPLVPAPIGQMHWRADMQVGASQRATQAVAGWVWQSAQGNVVGCAGHGMWALAGMRQALQQVLCAQAVAR